MTSVEYVAGDLFSQADVHALAQGVNTVGVMGAGIAVEFKRRWPVMFTEYAQLCHRGVLSPGGFHAWQAGPEHWIYNLATQPRPGKHAQLDYIRTSLDSALEHATAHDVPSLALPRIGAGYGGLAWSAVRDVIEAAVAGSTVRVRVVSL
jgi:O-acetyl-ADP-ribose deacetylase (regulator of RNase III)